MFRQIYNLPIFDLSELFTSELEQAKSRKRDTLGQYRGFIYSEQ